MNNKNAKKKKGYMLVIVMVFSLILSITAVATFTIVMRYMFYAKGALGGMNSIKYETYQEDYLHEWI